MTAHQILEWEKTTRATHVDAPAEGCNAVRNYRVLIDVNQLLVHEDLQSLVGDFRHLRVTRQTESTRYLSEFTSVPMRMGDFIKAHAVK
jgi:hypothetical protein